MALLNIRNIAYFVKSFTVVWKAYKHMVRFMIINCAISAYTRRTPRSKSKLIDIILVDKLDKLIQDALYEQNCYLSVDVYTTCYHVDTHISSSSSSSICWIAYMMDCPSNNAPTSLLIDQCPHCPSSELPRMYITFQRHLVMLILVIVLVGQSLKSP